jgi:RND superfamily putative drug exporter
VIGIGMAAAILIDATVVRLLLIPAVMFILGDRNWWMPKALSFLPEFHVEGHPDQYRTSADSNNDTAYTEPVLVS